MNQYKVDMIGTSADTVIGGIAGENTSKSSISSCYNTGELGNSSASSSSVVIGGIAGKNDQAAAISYCYNSNDKTKTGGAIVGTNYGSLKHCFYLKNEYILGIGYDSYSAETHDLPKQADAKTAAQMKTALFVETLNTDDAVFALFSESAFPVFEYEMPSCKVTFLDSVGNVSLTTTVAPGTSLSAISDLDDIIDKDGFVFVGRYTNESLTSKWNFSHDLVWGSLNLYPKYLEDGFVLWKGQSAYLYPFVAKYLPSSADLTWTTSDKRIATVSATCKVTAKSEGRVTITVFNEITKDSTSVTIYCQNALSKITIPIKTITGTAGKTQTITATIVSNGFTYDGIAYWKSSDTAVVRVVSTSDKNKNCTLKFMGPGKTTLTAVSNSGKKTNFKVIVTEATK